MFLPSRQRDPRRGIILLVVLALITLFASIGVAFVYFAEAEASKAQDQKAGETVKLPDADLMFNYVLRQLIFPTGNNSSALYTQSLLENMYGRTNGNTVQNVIAHNGTGWKSETNPAIDPTLPSGQDNLYRRNMQGRLYNENTHGSLNPPYTYPDHKNPYLGAVAANWRETDYATHLPINVNTHGPVAIARSWAREMKFLISIVDTTTSATVGVQEIVLNPFSGDSDFFRLISDTTITPVAEPATVPASAIHWQNYYMKRITLPIVAAPLAYTSTPGQKPLVPIPAGAAPPTIQCDADGSNAFLVLDRAACLAHCMRPTPRLNPNFPPPADLGGDVKNLPPEVKTLVGFNGTTPVFANNDSYWIDVGFPAIPWSNNRKIKPLVAMFIMDNDGKVNLQTAGNVRGQDAAGGLTYHTSAHGMGPWEVNPMKISLAYGVPLATVINDLGALMGGRYDATTLPAYLRGRAGYTSVLPQDPTTATGTYPSTAVATYSPIIRSAPPYAPYNLDGTYDGLSAPAWYQPSLPWQLAGDIYPPVLPNDTLYRRLPYFSAPVVVNGNYYNGYDAGGPLELQRGVLNKSPLFLSPFAGTQPVNNLESNAATGSQRMFGLQNHAELYLTKDTGADKFNGELRKLTPSSYLTAHQRWQQTGISNDLNVPGIAPWYTDAPPMPFTYPATGPYSALTSGGSGNPQAQSATPVTTGEFYNNANYAWRSYFGNVNNPSRLDLSRQLPDYPLPADNNTQLDLTNPVTRAQYMIALQARQRMAREIYNNLKALMHPNDDNGYRYIGQLAVNMVDYIDNDDYPTWFEVSDITALSKIVWGTELPRLLINEVYAEAVNNPGDTFPGGVATMGYDAHHWVELYNPLTNSNYPGVWPYNTAGTPSNLDAEARLNVGGTSAYRLIITRPSNMTNFKNADNSTGQPDSLTDAKTNIIQFPAGQSVQPSDNNYGNGTTLATNPGFYLVGPANPPSGASNAAVVDPLPLNFPTPNHVDPNMVISERYGPPPQSWTTLTSNPDHRQVILLQRLANPHLAYNPVPTDAAYNPLLPINPYITIDYADNMNIHKAITHDDAGMTAPTPVEERKSQGKLQPYAGMNDLVGGNVVGLWVDQRPDRENNVAGLQTLTAQPQHTFLRHNGVETDRPTLVPAPNPTPDTSIPAVVTNNNTLKLPFDWLVHLDRTPTSPGELLHVSGFKPHELTQQFNRLQTSVANVPSVVTDTVHWTRITPAAPATDVAPGDVIQISADNGLIGQHLGTPFSLRNGDLVQLAYDSPAGRVTDVVRVQGLVHQTNPTAATPSLFTANSNVTVTGITTVTVRLIVPFAHYAPWYRALQNVDVNSSSRLYRFLETVAVRNPGADVGQYRFTSAVPPLTTAANTANISAPMDVTPGVDNHSRWIQLDHGTMVTPGAGLTNLTSTRIISTNDALLSIRGADSVFVGGVGPISPYNLTVASNSPNSVSDTVYNVGDTVVINAGVSAGNVVEQRATILGVDQLNNRIRVVLSVPPAFATTSMTEPLTIDYTYVGGRQPGKININTVWDPETFRALADAQAMNSFYGPIANRDLVVDNVFTRLQQQRQPQYYYGPRMVGHSGQLGVSPEDRPFQGMATGDITASLGVPQQGIGNTFLSDRYQEQANGFTPTLVGPRADMTSPVGGDLNDVHRFTRSLFEIGNPGQDHPQRRFELLSKIWNNMTVRSNTFSVWITVGFFEYDEATGFGAELGQIQGKNTRYRFFAVVDRTQLDSWMQSWALHDGSANLNTFMDTNRFPNLDPRYATFPNMTAISQVYAAVPVPPSPLPPLTGSSMAMPTTVMATLTSANPFFNNDTLNATRGGRLVYVESDAGSEIAQIATQTAATITMQLTVNHTGLMTIRPLPVPPTVLHWTQMK